MADDIGGESGREVTRLWRVWRTARQMCADRGYQMLDEEINVSLDEFRSRFVDENGVLARQSMNFSVRPTDAMHDKYREQKTPTNPDPGTSIGTTWVEFNGDSNVGIKQLRQFVHYISKENFHTGIFVSAQPITTSALKIIPTVLPSIIETFQEQDLLVNITRHELVPKHILLSKEEKAALLQRYRLKESQLPRIQISDPVARYLGLRRGQVVKIIRKSETAGRYASYRWAI